MDPISAKIRKFQSAPLPPCPARHEISPEEGIYFCAHPRVLSKNNLVSTGVCRTCRQVNLPPPKDYLPFKPLPAYAFNGPCKHLGNVKELRECTTCRGNVRVKVFFCNHPAYEATTLGECRNCTDFEPDNVAELDSSPRIVQPKFPS